MSDALRPATDVELRLTPAHAMVLAQLCKRFTYDDAERLSDQFDSGRERDTMVDAVSALRTQLAASGYTPR
jgi:hypothetical protein